MSVQTIAASLLGCSDRDRGIPGLCGQGATAGAGSDGELGPQAMSMNAGYAGPGPKERELPQAEPKERLSLRFIGGAGRLVGVKADIPVTARA